MSSNVGLTTPRGSGTSGYVQRNLSHPKHRSNPYPTIDELHNAPKHAPRKPDTEILEHDRKRKIEVKILELRDKLEDAGELDEDAIDDKCEELRGTLEKEEEKREKAGDKMRDARGLKGWQTHELAEAKGVEQERMRKALGIDKNYEEGGHWKRQEERLRQGVREERQESRRVPEARKEAERDGLEDDSASEEEGSESDRS